MTLEQCYAVFGGDYAGVMSRLRSERLVQKFLLKFLADPSFENLQNAMAEKNQAEAFRASHTLKGLCLNMGFTKLGDSSHRLTEALREEWKPEAEALFAEVTADYMETASAVRALEANEN